MTSTFTNENVTPLLDARRETGSTELERTVPPKSRGISTSKHGENLIGLSPDDDLRPCECEWCQISRDADETPRGNAQLLASTWGRFRHPWWSHSYAVYCPDESAWYLTTGEDAGIFRRASRDEVAAQATVLLGPGINRHGSEWQDKSAELPTALRSIKHAESNTSLHIPRASFDAYPTAFVDGAGEVYDLETATWAKYPDGSSVEFTPPRMLQTRQAGVIFEDTYLDDDHPAYGFGLDDPATARSELWERFLEEVLPDAEVREYVRLFFGYATTGLTREEKLLLLYGPTGQNGKGVLLETVQAALGDYATGLQAESLLGRTRGRRTFDLAAVSGRRLVTLTEPPRGAKAATHLLKAVTGGDTLQVERKYGTPFSDRATYKLVIATNYLPLMRDRAMWRRIVVVPFDVRIPDHQVDPHLKEKLRQPEELRGVGGWLLRGARDYLARGSLPEPPKAIADATRRYQISDDPVTAFLSAATVDDPEAFTTNEALLEAFLAWCEDAGVPSGGWTKSKLGKELTSAGYKKRRRRVDGEQVYGRDGLKLAS